MSRAGYLLPSGRWGQRMGDGKIVDMMVGALTDPFDTVHMGVTAENVAAKWGITREQQDAFAVESHQRAAAAIAAGHFKEQILPIELKTKKGPVPFDTDEHVRGDATLEGMAKLKAVLQGGRHRHRRQRVGHQRRRRGRGADGSRRGQGARAQADGAAGLVRPRRRRPEDHGHRPGAGRAARAGQGGPQARRDGRHRVERSVRRAGAGRGQGTGHRPGQGQPERRRGRRWATRSARPARCSRSRRCTNCSAPASATRW